ncbi:MAG TPA: lytic transglycosylase domain-containing protein [Devosia sp.]|nr:lytic transglycosylase domain-containing protein [Devosia sp.]
MSIESIHVPQALIQVLNRAGDKSDVDFDYLVQTAMRESSLNPSAKARTSSAVGLFQFLEGTWLEVMKQEGGRLGYSNYVQAIERNAQGRYVVRDSELRQEILALREDPQVSADLAAAFTRRNGEYLENRFGRRPSPGELYIAHFLGARGAERMFNAGLENPDQIAASLFPRQAGVNRAIFYDSQGARTIREVYQALVAKHGQTSPVVQAVAQGADGVQQTQANSAPQPRFGPPVLAVQADMSFTNIYRSTATRQTTPYSVVVDPGAAFFAQLYGK